MTVELRVAELELVLEEPVVHLPEASLRAGGLGGLGGGRGSRVQVGEGHVPEHEPEPVSKGLAQSLHHRIGVAAIRALEVASVLDQRHPCFGVAAHVIAGGIDGRAEGGAQRVHGCSRSSRVS